MRRFKINSTPRNKKRRVRNKIKKGITRAIRYLSKREKIGVGIKKNERKSSHYTVLYCTVRTL